MTTIEWRDIPGFEGIYQVSNMGDIKRIKGGKGAVAGSLRKLKSNGKGYMVVILNIRNEGKTHYVHRLVMLAFVGECPDGMEVNHKNGVRHDNRLENLEYLTHKQNLDYSKYVLMVKPQYDRRGEKNVRAKLNEQKVREIRALAKQGIPTVKIAEQYNVTDESIYRIVKFQQWAHIAPEGED